VSPRLLQEAKPLDNSPVQILKLRFAQVVEIEGISNASRP
jgi:hypothetical protein